jgi:DeoR family transcriptional regulator of aga operon
MSMNRSERLAAVLDLLAESGHLEVDDIITRLGVSAATARRDLDTLASQQLLTRTRGGATGQSVAYDLPLRYKREQNAPQKLRIARAASSLVARGAVVGLCGGTTSTAIAEVLSARPDIMEASPHATLTVVTNALNIAAQLAMRPQIKTVVTGGVVHSRSYELVGSYSDAVLQQVRLDIAFIGVNGIDPLAGPSVNDEREAAVNSLMTERAARAMIVADSSKIGRIAFAGLGALHRFDGLITDPGITPEQLAAFADQNFEVIVAS